jgi:hypothetical protein
MWLISTNRDFEASTVHRVPDETTAGVTLLMGLRRRPSGIREHTPAQIDTQIMGIYDKDSIQDHMVDERVPEIITILFDRSKFTENGALDWWEGNESRLLQTSPRKVAK